MTRFSGFARLGPVVALCAVAVAVLKGTAFAAVPALPAAALRMPLPVEPARSILRDLFSDDNEDDFVHDNHYDWEAYRNSTSRKERVRDFYEIQRQSQKDYWKQQKEIQKDMIKRQRGW